GAGRGPGLPVSTGVGGGIVVAGGGGTPKKWARIWPAIGAADWPPAVPCSTITAIAMRGLSIGAKHMNQPCGWYWCDFLSVSSRACVTTWADPVLPATRMPGSCARQPVPPGATTAAMPVLKAAIVDGWR